MNTVIDTLLFSDKLRQGGFAVEQANTLARALGDELAEQLVTKSDLKTTSDTLNVNFESLEAKFESLEAKFDSLEAKFDPLEVKLNFLFALIGLLVILGLIPIIGPLLS